MINWNSKNMTDSSTEEFKYLDKFTNLKDKTREIYNKIDEIYIDELNNVSNNKPKEKVITFMIDNKLDKILKELEKFKIGQE